MVFMNDKDKDIVCILGLLLSPVLLGYVLPNVIFEIGYILFGGKSPMSLLVLVFGVLITAIILKIFFDSRDTTKTTKPKKDKTKKKRKSKEEEEVIHWKICKKCGYMQYTDEKICPKCGKKLKRY